MGKAVAKKKDNALAEASSLDAWGDNTDVTGNDLVIPKVLLMQFMSKKVKDDEHEAKFGEFRDNVDFQLLGNIKDKPIQFVPFMMEKVFAEFEIVGTKREFLRVIPIETNPAKQEYNDDAPYSWEEGGKSFERDRTYNYYVLIVAEDGSLIPMPHMMSFRRSSIKAGKNLATRMYVRNKTAQLPPPGMVMKLTGSKVENDKGEFGVMEIEPVRQSTDEEMGACLQWFKDINTAKASDSLNVEHTDFTEDGAGAGNGAKKAQAKGETEF